MSATRLSAIDAMGQAARRAVIGYDARVTAWTSPAEAAELAASIRPGAVGAHNICDDAGTLYFMADVSAADGPDIVR